MRNFPLDHEKLILEDEELSRIDFTVHGRWRQLLGADLEGGPVLSLQKTEDQFLRNLQAAGIEPSAMKISRTYDVDSFIAVLKSLAVLKGGMHFAYRPPYNGRVVQNQRVTLGKKGHQIHKLKHLRIGYGSAAVGSGFNCHIFFPNLHCGPEQTTHLSDDAQQKWIDYAVIPALHKACPKDVWSHHPRSWSEVKYKAGVKPENSFGGGQHQDYDLRYLIQEQYLEIFSSELVRLCNSDNRLSGFHDPFFMVSGHDLKLRTKQKTFQKCRDAFKAQLRLCFNWDDEMEQFPEQDCWLDLGFEDTPDLPGKAVTLLRRRDCTKRWMGLFASPRREKTKGPRNSPHLKKCVYPWSNTSDVVSGSVEMTAGGSFHPYMAYNKAYNLHKDIFSTPLKNFAPFGNDILNGLAYDQEGLQQWWDSKKKSGVGGRPPKRDHILDVLRRTKNRLSVAYKETRNMDFGARTEFRLNWRTFLALGESFEEHGEPVMRSGVIYSWPPETPRSELPRQTSSGSRISDQDESATNNAQQHAQNPPPSQHQPYWIVPTETANSFHAAQINRWLFYLESVAQRVAEGIRHKGKVDLNEQLDEGAMVKIVLRMLALSMSTVIPETQKAYFVDHYTKKDSPRVYWGLNVKESWQKLRVASLPMGRFAWENLVLIPTPAALVKFDCLREGPNRSHFGGHKNHLKIRLEGYRLSSFRKKLTTAKAKFPDLEGYYQKRKDLYFKKLPEDRNHQYPGEEPTDLGYWSANDEGESADTIYEAFRGGAELVVQQYVKDIWTILLERFRETNPDRSLNHFLVKLTDDDMNGLMGLNPSMIYRLYDRWNIKPCIAKARPTAKRWEKDWTALKYRDRLKALFDVDDGALDHSKSERTWNKREYRNLVHRLKAIVEFELGKHWGSRFMNVVYFCATRHLWMIPRYDHNQLAVMGNSSKKDKHREMKANSLECTSWITWSCSEGDRFIKPFSWHGKYGWTPYPQQDTYSDEGLKMCRERLVPLIGSMDVDVYHAKGGTHILGNPKDVGIDVCLHRAKRLQAEVEALWKAESTS